MSEVEKGGKEEIIKDGMLKIVAGSESVAVHAVNSAAAVLRVGLNNAEDLSVRAGDILLNTARKAISSGSIIGNDVREATKNIVKESIRATSEIGNEVKNVVSTAVRKETSAGGAEEQAKPE